MDDGGDYWRSGVEDTTSGVRISVIFSESHPTILKIRKHVYIQLAFRRRLLIFCVITETVPKQIASRSV
jgi:hypothetical protein